jgi:hypothetical protein
MNTTCSAVPRIDSRFLSLFIGEGVCSELVCGGWIMNCYQNTPNNSTPTLITKWLFDLGMLEIWITWTITTLIDKLVSYIVSV